MPVPLRTPRHLFKKGPIPNSASLNNLNPIPPVRAKPVIMKEVGVQTINFDSRGVQTDPLILLKDMFSILISIPIFLNIKEGGKFEVDCHFSSPAYPAG